MLFGVKKICEGGQERREFGQPPEGLCAKLRKEIRNWLEEPKPEKPVAATDQRSTVKDAAGEIRSEQTQIIPASSSDLQSVVKSLGPVNIKNLATWLVQWSELGETKNLNMN